MQWSKDEPLYWQHLTHQKSKITKKRYILTNNQFYILRRVAYIQYHLYLYALLLVRGIALL